MVYIDIGNWEEAKGALMWYRDRVTESSCTFRCGESKEESGYQEPGRETSSSEGHTWRWCFAASVRIWEVQQRAERYSHSRTLRRGCQQPSADTSEMTEWAGSGRSRKSIDRNWFLLTQWKDDCWDNTESQWTWRNKSLVLFLFPPISLQCSLLQNLTGSQLAKEKCGVQRTSPKISLQTREAGLGARR